MQIKTLLSVIVLTVTTMAQSDALGTLSALVSWGSSAISALGPDYSTNTQYSSLYAEYTSVWGGVTSQLAVETASIATNPTASAALASYVSRLGPEFSSITRSPFVAPTDAAGISSGGAEISRQLAQLTGGSATTTTATPRPTQVNAGSNGKVQVGAMGAAAVGVLGVAVWL